MSISNSEKRTAKVAAWTSAVLLSLVLLSLAPTVKADKVTDWNAIGAQVLVTGGNAGAAGSVDMAYMHIAIYDAVNAIEGGYTVFAVRPSNVPAGASAEAAVPPAVFR